MNYNEIILGKYSVRLIYTVWHAKADGKIIEIIANADRRRYLLNFYRETLDIFRKW